LFLLVYNSKKELVIKKILASSSYALISTLKTIKSRLEKLKDEQPVEEDQDKYLLFNAFDDSGAVIHPEICERMFDCGAIVCKDIDLPDNILKRLLEIKTKKTEKVQRKQRQRIFDVEDEIEEKRDGLINKLKKKLQQKTTSETLFIIRWKLV